MLYDVIIIGSGPAGIAASLYIKRANLKVLIISKGIGSLKKAEKIENYYGLGKVLTGEEVYNNGIKQTQDLNIKIVKDEVVKIDYINNFEVETINSIYSSKTVIIATGTSRKVPNIKGIKEFEGKGVSYCATCDAFFYRQKDVGVLGSKEYAIHEAEELKPIVNSVTIFTNGETPIENRSVDLKINENKIREVRGLETVNEIEFEDNSKEKIDGIFVALGTASSSDLARKIGARIDEKGNLIVNENMETTVPKLYACGDCTGGLLQISKAVYEGTTAGLEAIKRIRQEKNNI